MGSYFLHLKQRVRTRINMSKRIEVGENIKRLKHVKVKRRLFIEKTTLYRNMGHLLLCFTTRKIDIVETRRHPTLVGKT